MKARKLYTCPVCGYLLNDPAEDYNICPSCGTEFGLTDSGRTFKQLRDEWIQSGAHWHSRVTKIPKDWNPYVQMLNAGLVSITFGSSGQMTRTLDTAGARPAQRAANA
jgi:hypothetical protein